MIWNLKEAQEALQQIISELEGPSDYADCDAPLSVDMAHLYHHLNTAWNARHSTPERAAACTESDFKKWRQFPTELPME